MDHRLLLRRPVARPVPRRLAAHRRHRLARRPGLHADQRPHQGRHQVRRRVDLLGRARERGDGPPRRGRGGGDRRARRALERAPAGGRGARGRGRTTRPTSCSSSSTPRVSRWWLPERWAFIEEVPKTSVGKFDKKVLRARHADGDLEVIEVDIAAGRLTVPDLDELAGPPGGDRRGPGRRRPRPAAPERRRGAVGGEPDPDLAAEEKRITRARRAVEKAAGLLGRESGGLRRGSLSAHLSTGGGAGGVSGRRRRRRSRVPRCALGGGGSTPRGSTGHPRRSRRWTRRRCGARRW